jgi:cytochrome c
MILSKPLAPKQVAYRGRKTGNRLALLALLILLTGCGWRLLPRTDYTIPGGNVDRGRQAMTEYGCIACHTIPGVTRANATVGPPLTAWADRSAIAGQFPNTPEYLIQWLQDPQAMIPGSIMPDVGVPEVVARDMSAYLYTLERNALGLPWW